MLRAIVFIVVAAFLCRPAAAQSLQPQAAAPLPPADLFNQSQQLRLQIEALRADRAEYGIAGPIVMMGAGGGVALTAAYLYLVSSVFEDIPCHCSQSSRASDSAPCWAPSTSAA